MITRNERIIVEAVRRASSMSIYFNGVEIYVRNGEFSHDVAIALQSHFNRQHKCCTRKSRHGGVEKD